MRKTLLSAALILLSLHLTGQAAMDTLFLRNGSVIYGKLSKNPNLFKIKTPDGYYFSFDPEEVLKYKTVVPQRKIFVRERGISFCMESGLHIGGGDFTYPIQFSINPMIIYTLNPIHSFSAGTGLDLFDDLKLPLFLEYNANFSNKDVTTFFFTRIGSLIPLRADEGDIYYKSDIKTGWTFVTGFGLKWPMGAIESYIKFGYRYAFTREVITDSYSTPPLFFEHKYNFNCLEMDWGFRF